VAKRKAKAAEKSFFGRDDPDDDIHPDDEVDPMLKY
jgi:hypothetical protein